MRIVFIQPTDLDDLYYQATTALMRQAADRLGVGLEILVGGGDAERVRGHVRDLVGRSPRPDYVLAVNNLSLAVEVVPELSAAGLPVLLISQELLKTERFELGEPGDPHRHWIGSLLPDDQQAGRLLAATLIDKARRRGLVDLDGTVHVCGLGGTYTAASIQRITGLRRALAEHEDSVLGELLPGSWRKDRATVLVEELIRRDPKTTVVWAANDAMAAGAVEALVAAGKRPGHDVLVGGIDWAPFVVDPIERGDITASVGGHFLEGARAVLALYDHHHGVAFDPPQQRTEFAVLDAATLRRYRPLLDLDAWRHVDLTRFSRVRHPDAPRLTTETVLELF